MTAKQERLAAEWRDARSAETKIAAERAAAEVEWKAAERRYYEIDEQLDTANSRTIACKVAFERALDDEVPP